MIDLNKIDNTWTLFLDRDGVINHEKHLDYIHTWYEFTFYEGVKEAIAIFAKIFHRIIGKKGFEFAVELGCQGFVVRNDQGRFADVGDDIGNGKSLARSRHPQESLVAISREK